MSALPAQPGTPGGVSWLDGPAPVTAAPNPHRKQNSASLSLNSASSRYSDSWMETMRALVAAAVGEPADVLRLETNPIPTAGPGQVRVRVQAAPINPNDLHIMRGRYGIAPPMPTPLGQEAVGVVDALGDGVNQLRIGQRVVTVGLLGTWQDYVVHNAAQMLPVPDGLSTSTAAQLVTNPLTATLLVSELDVQPGEWLLQTAAGSTVGRLVLQLAGHQGFQTINVIRRQSAAEEIRALGGTEVISTDVEDLRTRVAEIAGRDGVRKAIDAVGGQIGADVSRSLAPLGTTLVYGALSTHRQTEPGKLTIPLFARSLIYESKTVRGFWLYRWFQTATPEQIRGALANVFQLVGSGVLRIPEGTPVRPEDVAEGLRLAETPGRRAKPLLIFSQQ
jgi:NADPH:quinone reductase-like Zn-dependent oxidoreductase